MEICLLEGRDVTLNRKTTADQKHCSVLLHAGETAKQSWLKGGMGREGSEMDLQCDSKRLA